MAGIQTKCSPRTKKSTGSSRALNRTCHSTPAKWRGETLPSSSMYLFVALELSKTWQCLIPSFLWRREREAQATLLALSIEGNANSKAQTELENASDEEEKYSAVVRPGHNSGGAGGETGPRERREPRDFRDFRDRTGGTPNSSSGCKTSLFFLFYHNEMY